MSGAISPTYQSFYELFGLKQKLENRSFQQKVLADHVFLSGHTCFQGRSERKSQVVILKQF